MTRDEWDKLPQALQLSLLRAGFDSSGMTPSKDTSADPYTKVGATSLKGEYTDSALSPDTGAVTVEARDPFMTTATTSEPSAIVYNPKYSTDKATNKLIHAHEMEHVLANQGGGWKKGVNERWDDLMGRTGEVAPRETMVQRLLDAAPYLQKNWGLQGDMATGYFDPAIAKRPRNHLYFSEQLATLSALEQMANKRLTDDPYMQKNVFKTPGERETYNAITGLRQTRLDAKDLPPYTRQPETRPDGGGWLSNLRALVTGNK